MSREMWDQRYADEEYLYGTTPNVFFKQELDKLKPGKILLPAEGEGRNAVYAASMGWDVYAFDQSEEGRRKAIRLAEEKKVVITYVLSDLENAEYQEEFFDAIGLMCVHSPGEKRQLVHRNLSRFLKPGGTLILTGFSKEQLQFTSGGPKELSWLFSVEELKADFEAFSSCRIEHSETLIEEGPYHKGMASMIQMVAVK
ncbi:MAG: class I SAM-dependent methyltransferase [Bacteroidota bacterium]